MNQDTVVAVAQETGAQPVLSSRERKATVAAQVWDALSRRQPELPNHLLADPEVAPLRRRIEALNNERWHTIEGPLVRQSLAAVASAAAARSIVELLASRSNNVLDIARAQSAVEAHIAVESSWAPADDAVRRFRVACPHITSAVVVTDPVMTLNIPRTLPRPAIFACLGGAIGRFTTISAIRCLRAIRAAMTPRDRLMLGVDLRSATSLETDHMRERSLRERLHRHVLTAVNRACGTDFDLSRFRYHARYDAQNKRLNLGLESVLSCVVRVPNMKSVSLPSGSVILTGVQCIYDRRCLQAMLLGVGLIMDTWHEHDSGEHAVATVSSVHCDARG